MVSGTTERRLVAILAVDLVGYSRLVGIDEEGTIARLSELRDGLFDRCMADHHGRVVKTLGDGILAEFSSVVDAMRCAVELQRTLAERNVDLPADKRMDFRIGVNLGDIVVQGDDILGDGVNVAARLESLAEPGGICISRKVFQEIHNKLDVGYAYIGEQRVKNISAPVAVYRVVLDAAAGTVTGDEPVARARRHPRTIAALLAVLLSVSGALAFWYFQPLAIQPASSPQLARQQSDSPSIAVLPFENMSDDASQIYFADGIAEDIITDLSKISGLFVTARNTAFQYRGRSVDIVNVGGKLGVQYILEGSVRRSANQIRINAQLIDARTGGHVWAERYDGAMADVFSLQDRVTGNIISALKLRLTTKERQAVAEQGTTQPAAYDAYLRGLALLAERRRIDVEANRGAQTAFSEAISLDPDYALAYAGLAWAKWLYRATISEYQSSEEIFALAEKSITLRDNALAHRTLSKRHFSLQLFWGTTTKKFDLAVVELERARQLQPNDADVLADLAAVLSFGGQPKRALTLVRKAMQLNPDHPDWYFSASGIALLLTGQPDRAIRDLHTWAKINPAWDAPYIFLAAALANSGDVAAAQDAVARFNALYGPGTRTTLAAIRTAWPMAPEQEEIFFKGLRLAGMKETPG